MATIVILPPGTIMQALTDSHVVMIGDRTVAMFSCPHQASHLAQQLDKVRQSGHRLAMQILTQEVGMCESAAEEVYTALKGDDTPSEPIGNFRTSNSVN